MFKKYKSFAKINLFLDVIEKLKNGYHNIRSIFSEISVYDIIRYKKNNLGILRYFDEKKKLPDDNLLNKAGNVFLDFYNHIVFGIDFYINKMIPIGGGLGGGSSNAASILKILNKEWSKKLGNNDLIRLSKMIGADVAFFINGGIQKVEGIGDKTEPILINNKLDLKLLFIYPDIAVSTQHAYKLIDDYKLNYNNKLNFNKYEALLDGLKFYNYSKIIKNIYNKFEDVIFKEYPVIAEAYNNIMNTNADRVFMTGSGSTLVGIFDTNRKLLDSAALLKDKGYNCTTAKIIL